MAEQTGIKVKDLIAWLQQCDQESEVWGINDETGECYPREAPDEKFRTRQLYLAPGPSGPEVFDFPGFPTEPPYLKFKRVMLL